LAWVSTFRQLTEYLNHVAEMDLEEPLTTEIGHVSQEIAAFVERLRVIPAVEQLRFREIEQGFKTWVIVNDSSEEARYAVYEAEWDLMRQFPGVAFDLHLVDREGENLGSIIHFDEGTLSIPIRGVVNAR